MLHLCRSPLLPDFPPGPSGTPTPPACLHLCGMSLLHMPKPPPASLYTLPTSGPPPPPECLHLCRIPLLPNHGKHELESQLLGNISSGIAKCTQFQSCVARWCSPLLHKAASLHATLSSCTTHSAALSRLHSVSCSQHSAHSVLTTLCSVSCSCNSQCSGLDALHSVCCTQHSAVCMLHCI